MKKIAVILSGCGAMDGSEIHESVLTLLALSKQGVHYQCLAPNMPQSRVINHFSKLPESTRRNILEEAARIARGDIIDITQARVKDYAAVIIPGGSGAAWNLSDFASKGVACTVQPDVAHFVKAMAQAGKPLGFICIAPVLIAKILGPGIKMTIGNDQATADKVTAMGNIHVECRVTECIVDDLHKVVSTPAYMLGKSIAEVASGIEALVQQILNFIA
jgi:enhancing lycopene biosynthesis protein 2